MAAISVDPCVYAERLLGLARDAQARIHREAGNTGRLSFTEQLGPRAHTRQTKRGLVLTLAGTVPSSIETPCGSLPLDVPSHLAARVMEAVTAPLQLCLVTREGVGYPSSPSLSSASLSPIAGSAAVRALPVVYAIRMVDGVAIEEPLYRRRVDELPNETIVALWKRCVALRTAS